MSDITRTRKAPRNMGLGLFLLGAIFLFDPFVSVFDFLPDAIGYVLLAQGLARMADMDDRLAEARRSALRLSLFGLLRILALVLTFALMSASERPVFILLVVFSMAVIDLVVLLPMWRNFGEGISYLGSRNGATAIFDAHRGGKSPIERYVSYTTVYFVLREVLAVLPELTVLTHERGGAEFSGGSLYYYIGTFRAVGCVLSLAMGVLWLCMTARILRSIRSDKPFLEALHAKYEGVVATRHTLFAMRSIKAATVALSAASIFAADFYVEGVSLIPDPLVAVAMAVAILSLGRYAAGKHRLPLILTALYGVAATASWVLQFKYLSFNDLTDKALVAERMATVDAVQTVTAILFVASFLLTLRLLYGLVRRYTGVRPMHDGSTAAAEHTQSIHKHIRRKLVWVGVFAVITAYTALALWTIAPLVEALDVPVRPDKGDALLIMVYDFYREAYWMVDLAMGVIFAILTVHASNEIAEQLNYSELMN